MCACYAFTIHMCSVCCLCSWCLPARVAAQVTISSCTNTVDVSACSESEQSINRTLSLPLIRAGRPGHLDAVRNGSTSLRVCSSSERSESFHCGAVDASCTATVNARCAFTCLAQKQFCFEHQSDPQPNIPHHSTGPRAASLARFVTPAAGAGVVGIGLAVTANN